MRNIPYIIIIVAFLIDFVVANVPGGRIFFRMAPEMLSALVIVVVAIRVGQRHSLYMSPKYLTIFIVFLITIMAGVAANVVQPGAIFAGILIYLRCVPFFLLPVVYESSEQELAIQLKLALGLALLQFPVSIYQRFIQFGGGSSGDSVVGTLGLSSNLSIVLICCAAILMGFYLKGRILTKQLLIILFLLLVPTMINETTISLFLIPIALIVPAFFVKGVNKIKGLLQISAIATLLLIVFVVVYNSYYSRWGGGGF